jgi:serine/threonine-protein kinase
LKPSNVFLSEQRGEGQVKVLDFGIAKLSGPEAETLSALTSTGATLGTPCYMAPEQGFGEPGIDHRADIWSLGAILYECLTGGRPVEGDNLGQVLKGFMTQGITPLHSLVPDLPRSIADLVMRMLSREARERPADLREVHATLCAHCSTVAPAFQQPLSPRASVVDDLERSSTGLGTMISAGNAQGAAGTGSTVPHSVSVAAQPPAKKRTPVLRLLLVGVLVVAASAAVLTIRAQRQSSSQARPAATPLGRSAQAALPTELSSSALQTHERPSQPADSAEVAHAAAAMTAAASGTSVKAGPTAVRRLAPSARLDGGSAEPAAAASSLPTSSAPPPATPKTRVLREEPPF